MTDPRRLLARLNPATARYDAGLGGIPSLTAQDIAAAIAFVPAGLGREVMCAVWWPDGAVLTRRVLHGHVARIVHERWRKQQRDLADARIELGMAHAIAGWHGRTTDEQRRNIRRAEIDYEAAKTRCWPDALPSRLKKLTETALIELAGDYRCRRCDGRGHVITGNLVALCEACSGSGAGKMSDCERALLIGVNESTFRRVWTGVYQWLLTTMADAELQARESMDGALSE